MFNLFGHKKAAAPVAPAVGVVEAARRTIPTVKFDLQRVTAEVEAAIRAVIAETAEIPQSDREKVFQGALGGVRRGRDLAAIFNALSTWPRVEISKARKSEIAREISNRTTTMMNRHQQLSSGVREATWMYSGAPCYSNRKPTDEDRSRDAAHRASNGQKFEVSEGMLI